MADQKTKTVKHYQDMQVKTSGFKGLICFMHEKSLTLLKSGIEECRKRDIERAQNMIFQLELALDKNEETSKLLSELYAYCYYLLETADPQNIIIARKILGTLGEAFAALAKQKR